MIAQAEILTGAPGNIPLADAAALPLVSLTARQALFDHGKLTTGQRVLINGAGGAVGGYAVQLAKEVGAHVIATAGPCSAERVTAAGADEAVDHTATDVTAAVTDPVDLPQPRPGGAGAVGRAAHTNPRWRQPSSTPPSGCLAAPVSTVELRVEVAERVALADLLELHAQAGAGELPGKTVVRAPTA